MSLSADSPSRSERSERRAQVIALLKPRRPHTAPHPCYAYGVYLTEECLLDFGIMMRTRIDPHFNQEDPAQLRSSKSFAVTKLPLLCLVAIPGLWLSRWHTYLVRTNLKDGFKSLIVLADDGSEENKTMKNTSEVVKELVNLLRLGEQQPAWYPLVS